MAEPKKQVPVSRASAPVSEALTWVRRTRRRASVSGSSIGKPHHVEIRTRGILRGFGGVVRDILGDILGSRDLEHVRTRLGAADVGEADAHACERVGVVKWQATSWQDTDEGHPFEHRRTRLGAPDIGEAHAQARERVRVVELRAAGAHGRIQAPGQHVLAQVARAPAQRLAQALHQRHHEVALARRARSAQAGREEECPFWTGVPQAVAVPQ